MATKNDITGDSIKTGHNSDAYRNSPYWNKDKKEEPKEVPIKSRKEVADYINSGGMKKVMDVKFKHTNHHHFGIVEIRHLMDFIYGSEPKEDEFILEIGE